MYLTEHAIFEEGIDICLKMNLHFMLKEQKAKMFDNPLCCVYRCFCFPENLGSEAPHLCIFIHVFKLTTSL